MKVVPDEDGGEYRDERGRADRKLQMNEVENTRQLASKRKNKQSSPALQTPNLNEPIGSNAILHVRLVNSRLSHGS